MREFFSTVLTERSDIVRWQGIVTQPGTHFLQSRNTLLCVKIRYYGTRIDCSCSVIFLGRELGVFSPLAHADTEGSSLGRMCYFHRIDIVSRRSEGIKCVILQYRFEINKNHMVHHNVVHIYIYRKNKLL